MRVHVDKSYDNHFLHINGHLEVPYVVKNTYSRTVGALGDLLFLRNGFRYLCTTFFKKYLYIIQEIFLKIARNYIWAKQNQTTFYLIKMAGKLFNLKLVGFKDDL